MRIKELPFLLRVVNWPLFWLAYAVLIIGTPLCLISFIFAPQYDLSLVPTAIITSIICVVLYIISTVIFTQEIHELNGHPFYVGDKVLVLKGQFKGKIGTVSRSNPDAPGIDSAYISVTVENQEFSPGDLELFKLPKSA
jgi:amino acid transporter